MSASTHSFSIENTKQPGSEEAFGAKYAGTFTIRRPTLRDNANISLKYSAAVSVAGTDVDPVRLAMIPAINLTYIFCYIGVIAEEKPEWFKSDLLYEEDEAAVHAVFEEVERWLASFRPQTASAPGEQGSADNQVLVSAKV